MSNKLNELKSLRKSESNFANIQDDLVVDPDHLQNYDNKDNDNQNFQQNNNQEFIEQNDNEENIEENNYNMENKEENNHNFDNNQNNFNAVINENFDDKINEDNNKNFNQAQISSEKLYKKNENLLEEENDQNYLNDKRVFFIFKKIIIFFKIFNFFRRIKLTIVINLIIMTLIKPNSNKHHDIQKQEQRSMHPQIYQKKILILKKTKQKKKLKFF